jgi:hypothetical protein
MAVSSAALNLAQYANLSNDPLVRAVTNSLRDHGSVLTDLPIRTNPSMKAKGVRWTGDLPTVDWVPLNTEGTTVSGTPTPFEEQVYILRNYIDVDKALVIDQNQIVDPRAAQLDHYLRSVAFDVNFKFINNNHNTGDIDAPVGIRKRLDAPDTYGTRADCKIDAGAVDMSQAGMTAATANNFIEFLDQTLWAVNAPEGDGVTLYMNEVMKRRFARALRLLGPNGGFSTAQDQYNRSVDMYKGAVIKDIGYKADQTTRIITTTETATGAADTGGTATSIYAVKYGEGAASAWQMWPLVPTDKGLLENGTVYRTIIDWAVGLYFANTRSIARLYNVKVA